MSASPWRCSALVPFVVLGGLGCATGGPRAVSPDEIPHLERRLSENPDDGETQLRYAAALYAAGRCETAVPAAERGIELSPANPLGPLVLGQCLEEELKWREAVDAYDRHLEANPEGEGAAALGARRRLARRDLARAQAAEALGGEDSLSSVPADPDVVAILPLVVIGDSTYQTLSLGLAQMLLSDLFLLDRFRFVERIELNAILQELQLARTDRMDASTSARVGRLVRAGRMVQGLLEILPSEAISAQADVVLPTSEVVEAASVNGALTGLLTLEKELAIEISVALGYTPSEAERQRILENGTRNLIAFLSYARGIGAEAVGDYAQARLHFAAAVREDPGFTQAREELRAAAADEAASGSSPERVTSVAGTVNEAVNEALAGLGVSAAVLGSAVNNGVLDVGAHQSERILPRRAVIDMMNIPWNRQPGLVPTVLTIRFIIQIS